MKKIQKTFVKLFILGAVLAGVVSGATASKGPSINGCPTCEYAIEIWDGGGF